MSGKARCVALGLAAAAYGLALLTGCSSNQQRKPLSVRPVVRDTPAVLRGTIGSEVTMTGIEPVLVSGYGFVVGLNGTGGEELPDNIAASMEREMGLLGIGKAGSYENTLIDGMTPRQLLRDRNTAVVVVQAAIPPGAPPGTTFDVFVEAINATSIEGGRLWTTELQIGTPSTFREVQARRIARARGPLFINPFVEPGTGRGMVTQNLGRILDGGIVTNPFAIQLVLDNPSHARARSIVSVINSRFPEGPGDREPPAHGRSDGIIDLKIPARYVQNPSEFINLVQALPVTMVSAEERARQYCEALKSEPGLADQLALCLAAIGSRALPFVRDLYDYPEWAPRLAALKAGAMIGDTRAAGPLRDIAEAGPPSQRAWAIRQLGDLDAGPTVDMTLRGLLDERELSVRVAAYESLVKRATRQRLGRLVADEASRAAATGAHRSMSQLEALAAANLPAGMIQGVHRRMIGDKFFLDVVPVGEPLIYITQQGRPRIVLFGEDLKVQRPTVVSAWSGRFMLASESSQDPIRVYYDDGRTGRPVRLDVPESLPELVEVFARTPTPEDSRPGLDMTYAEIVGVLHELYESRATLSAFATESDKLRAQVLAAASSGERLSRPETPDDKEELIVLDRPGIVGGERPARSDRPPTIVPVTGNRPK